MSNGTSNAAGWVTRTTKVVNRYGIHARPAALIVKTATSFASTEVTLQKGGDPPVSAKSIMGLLTIAGHQGTGMTIAARGPEADQAVNAILDLFERKFFEE